MDTKHTPGPWVQAGQICVCTVSGRLIFVVRQPSGTSDLTPDDEMEANTRLCAAGPEMLAALIAVRDWNDEDGNWTPVLAKVRAAIRKATGEPR
jgi:hypothetical protein